MKTLRVRLSAAIAAGKLATGFNAALVQLGKPKAASKK
jgi:hypothetical protein